MRHGATVEVGAMGIYTCLYNVLGWPAGVVPWTRVRAGEESDRPPSKDPCFVTARESERGAAGLPIGVQVAARPWRDHVALAAMAALERDAQTRADYPRTPVEVAPRGRQPAAAGAASATAAAVAEPPTAPGRGNREVRDSGLRHLAPLTPRRSYATLGSTHLLGPMRPSW